MVIPGWLALAARLHGGWPSLYRALGGIGDGLVGLRR